MWRWQPKGLVPFKAAPSHLFLTDAPMVGKGLQMCKVPAGRNITAGGSAECIGETYPIPKDSALGSMV